MVTNTTTTGHQTDYAGHMVTNTTTTCDQTDSWFVCLVPFIKQHELEILFYTAGFLTASLIFSFVCIVSKCQRTSRQNNDRNKDSQDTGMNQSVASLNIEEHGNEGSCDSDLKSYACVSLNKPNDNTDDFTESLKSNKGHKRESYDVINHIQENPSDVKLNNFNVYSHVKYDMEMTEYNTTSYIKSKLDTKDPTYSHLSGVKRTADLTNPVRISDNTTVRRCHLDTEINKTRENKQGTIIVEKKLKSENSIQTTVDNRKENDTDVTISHCYDRDSTDHGKLHDNQNNDQFRRNKFGYSFVRKPKLTDDAEKFVIEHSDVTVSDSVSSGQSITSVEASEDETRCLLDSDMTSSQTVSETDSGPDCPLNDTHEPLLAINALYDNFELENGKEIDDMGNKSLEDIKMELTACSKDT